MKQYIYNPPLLIKYLFNDSRWYTTNNQVLLTFDDGPVNGNTDLILKQLNDYNIKALFFCVGNNILNNGLLTEEILKEGHSIGSHTMNHKVLSRAGTSTIAGEILPLSRLMEEKYGYTIKYFRPPHGRYSFRLRNFLNEHNLKNVMWSLLTYDYRNDINTVRKSLNYLRSDSIVVLHDSIKSREVINDSITMLMDKVSGKGFTTGTPDECLK